MTDAGGATVVGRSRSAARAALAWLAVAWAVWLAGMARAERITAGFVGPGDDVTDSFRRASYIAERRVGFDGVAVAAGCVLLGAAGVTGQGLLGWLVLGRPVRPPGGRREATWWGVLAWLLLVPSALLHGAVLLLDLASAG